MSRVIGSSAKTSRLVIVTESAFLGSDASCEVVPAIAGSKQPVAIAFDLTWKEHQEATLYRFLDAFDKRRDLDVVA